MPLDLTMRKVRISKGWIQRNPWTSISPMQVLPVLQPDGPYSITPDDSVLAWAASV